VRDPDRVKSPMSIRIYWWMRQRLNVRERIKRSHRLEELDLTSRLSLHVEAVARHTRVRTKSPPDAIVRRSGSGL